MPSVSSYGMYILSAASRQAAASSVSTPRAAASIWLRVAHSAALRRLDCAIRLVNTLLSAMALYSSGPVTPSIRNRPTASWWPSERHIRAVSTSSSRPMVRSNSRSLVDRT